MVGHTDQEARLDDSEYRQVGPAFEIKAIELISGGAVETVEVRPFNIKRVYLLGRCWLVGSCPHVFSEDRHGKLHHLGEILSAAWMDQQQAEVQVGPDVGRIHIAECEFERTVIDSIAVNGEIVVREIELNRGEVISIAVSPGDVLLVKGHYESVIRGPKNGAHLRQQRSLVAAGMRRMSVTTKTWLSQHL